MHCRGHSCPNECHCSDPRKEFRVELHCSGLSSFPSLEDLPINTTSLRIMNSSITHIPAGVLEKRKKIAILILSDNEIKTIDDGAFDGLEDLFEINLDINRLEKFPVFKNKSSLRRLFLNYNNIKELSQISLGNLPELIELKLDYTHITEIPAYAFHQNKNLLKLSLKYSWLSKLDDNAFADSNLQHLFLQKTRITSLPSTGLENLKTLNLKDVDDFWSIPPGLKSIREVHVSEYNSFLCCAFYLGTYQRDYAKREESKGSLSSSSAPTLFSKSETENPVSVFSKSSTVASVKVTMLTMATQNSDHYSNSSTVASMNLTTTPAATTIESPWGWNKRRRRRRYLPQGPNTVAPKVNGSSSNITKSRTSPLPAVTTSGSNSGGGGGFIPGTAPSLSGTSAGGFLPGTSTTQVNEGSFLFQGGFVNGTVSVPATIPHEFSPNSSIPIVTEPPPEEIKCSPARDAFQPCEDIMGAKWLTVVSLLVGGVALISNLVVVIVMMSSERRLNVHRFLMSNLAFADFCLGLYIFVLVCASLNTSGEYYNRVKSWQYGAGCQITGFLAVFSTELSVYTLTLITIERFFAIVYAMEVNYRLSLRKAVKIMILGWLFAFILAVLPLFGVNSYKAVAICLPFNSDSKSALAYVSIVLVLNFGTFLVIAGLYAKMFQVVVGPGPVEGAPQRNDAKVAKRMALLVFTDFVCWTPIAVFGLLAAFGTPLIGVEESKFLLVFFFPLNSLCNPFLYAFFTKAFKREFFSLLSRFGFCHTRALRYKGTLSSLIYSRTRTKRSTIGEDDTRTKRISQISATSAPTLNGSAKENAQENGNCVGHVYEYIAMKGVNNNAFCDTSPVSPGNDEVFFDPTTRANIARAGSPDWPRDGTPQLLRAQSVGSLHAVEGQVAETKSKKQSVSFRDDPQIAGRKEVR